MQLQEKIGELIKERIGDMSEELGDIVSNKLDEMRQKLQTEIGETIADELEELGQQKIEDLEALNRTLIVAERRSRDEVEEARKELMTVRDIYFLSIFN